MAWVILGLGLALCVSGAAALWSGVSYMPVEWGWSQIIAGATAVSGGVVTIGLAAVVYRLGALQSALFGLAAPLAGADELAPEDDARAEAAPSADLPEPEPPAERMRAAPPSRPILIVPPAAADEVPAEPNGHGRRVGIADVVGLENPPPEPAPPAEVSIVPPPERMVESAELAEAGVDEAATQPDGAQRTVVGRYEAGGASYALFSDGTIEVETETGTHRFGSMEELKAFLEQQDRAGQADWPE